MNRSTQFPASWRQFLIIGCIAVLASCEGHSTMTIGLHSTITNPTDLDGIRLRVNGREFSPEDFSDRRQLTLNVPNHGRLLIELELVESDELVAGGAFAVDLYPDVEWRMNINRQAGEPICIGCRKQRFEISAQYANEPGEAVWVTWGGVERGSGIDT